MIYLLDTCVVSDFIKADKQTLFHIRSKSPQMLGISSITIMEITYGLALNPSRKVKIQHILNDFLKVIQVIPFEQKDAESAGEIRSYLKEKGTPIGSYDVLLAGTAVNRDMILVTSNLGEFQRVKGLNIENWRD